MERKNINKTYEIEIKNVDEDKRLIEAVISKEIVDRDGDIVKIDGVDLKQYKKNPILLWSHNQWDLPIGKATSIKKDGKELRAKFQYASGDEYSFADTVYRLTKGGYIKAYSISFAPDWEEAERNEKTGGYTFNKSTLLEVSAVNVPANPQALVSSKAIQKALEDNVIDDTDIDEIEFYLQKIKFDQVEEEVDKKFDEMEKEDTVFDEIEVKDLNKEQTLNKCNECGHELICPHCKDIEEEQDSDPLNWLFKDIETEESKDESNEDLVDELLNLLKDEVQDDEG